MAEGFTVQDQAEALAEFLERYPRALVLTGAGLSTASGIPDYRDRDGTRRGRTPIQGPEFRRSPEIQRRYWARSMIGWPIMAQARPNHGHRALSRLEKHGRIKYLLTQNVDGLHQQAGSLAVLELHGNVHSVVCMHCKAQFPRAFVQTLLNEANPELANVLATPLPDGDAAIEPDAIEDFHVPFCVHCGGALAPDVVFFGDGIPPARTACALAQMEAADALLVVGSSLMVYSGFRFCRMAQEAGKPIAAVNLGLTRADHLIALKIEESAERLLPRVADLLHAEEPEESHPLLDHRGIL
ncbi:NAD-dependent protein deacetylase [Massilia sp. IC2-477]|uniref:NAD-dependent protein deacetylase n=1 Tax=unclassified Massilia TaxID=2609279 RepID=UPI001D11F790|nr:MULTISPECIES: NAD-dependent protein deacetylase [unclassified Massilia]MCC2955625.1 NAD-dependent protein deacetylase [Massilia sp. IC2-477]MCC2974355.1 NAD-dependent protein deacetylase [Massilia sp. IC2-476]